MSHDLVITDVRPMPDDASPMASVDIVIRDGMIAEVRRARGGADRDGIGDGIPVVDGAGALVFPAFVDAHTHMDKSLLGMPWHRHEVGPGLMDKIVNERDLVQRIGLDSHQQSMQQVRRELVHGTTAIRTFSDINTVWGLDGLHGLVRTREALGERMDIQIVAFPQSGMMPRQGTVELMDAAMREGADIVGGLDPCVIDRDPAGHLDTIFALAEKHDADIDIHLHEPGELGAFSLDLIIERTRTLGWQGRVVISHALCLGGVDEARYHELTDALLELDIAVMTHGPSGHRAAPDVARLRALGVRVCTGNDGIRDAWGPLNKPDMLHRAYTLAYRNNLRRDDAIEEMIRIVTSGSAEVMGLPARGVFEGAQGDLVLVDAETHVQAVVDQPARRAVIRRGEIVAEHGELTIDL